MADFSHHSFFFLVLDKHLSNYKLIKVDYEPQPGF